MGERDELYVVLGVVRADLAGAIQRLHHAEWFPCAQRVSWWHRCGFSGSALTLPPENLARGHVGRNVLRAELLECREELAGLGQRVSSAHQLFAIGVVVRRFRVVLGGLFAATFARLLCVGAESVVLQGGRPGRSGLRLTLLLRLGLGVCSALLAQRLLSLFLGKVACGRVAQTSQPEHVKCARTKLIVCVRGAL